MPECLLCGKEMEPEDGWEAGGLACDKCIARNWWEDFNEPAEELE